MPDEYILPIGADASGLLNDIKQMKQQIGELQALSKQSTTSMQAGFSAVSDAQSKATQSIITGSKAIKDQAGIGQQLAQVYSTLAAAASRASDSAPIKKYANEFQKLADLAGKTTTLSVGFDDADLITLAGSIDETKGQMAGLIAVTDLLKTKLTSLDPNSDEFKLLSEQVNVADQVIKEFNGEVENTHGKLQTTRTELLAMKEELVRMDEAGQGGTEAFQDLSIAAAKLQNTIRESAERVRVLASNTKYIDATIEGLRALTAGFGLAEGATALFGDENKDLAEVLEKVQGAMLILQSLQEIQQIVNKASALSVLTTKAAHAANTVAIEGEAGAMAVDTVATEAATTATKGFWATLLSNPIGWLLALVGALIAVYTSLKDSFDLAAESEKDLNIVRGESLKAVEGERLELGALLIVARDENKTKKERQDAIDAINKKMPEYNNNITIENVNTQAVTDQISVYINQLQKKALAQAYISQIQKLYTQLIDSESSSLEDNIKWYNYLWATIRSGGETSATLVRATQAGIANRKENVENIQKEIDALSGKFDADIKSGKAIIETDTKTTESKKKAAANDKKIQDDSNRLEENYQKALLEIKKRYSDLTIDFILSDRDKAKAEAKATYLEQVKQIQDLLDEQKKSGKSSAELTQAAEKAKAAIKKKYTNTILTIDAKFYEDQKNALIAANQVINSVTETKEQSDIDAANKRFDDLIKDLNAKSAQIVAQQGVLSEKDLALISAYNNAVIDANEAREVVIANIKRDAALQSLNTQKDLAISTVEALKVSGISEEDLTKLISEKKLDIQKDYAARSLKLIEDNLVKEGKLTQDQVDALTNENLQKAAGQGISIFQLLGIDSNLDEDTKKKIQEFLTSLGAELKKQSESDQFSLNKYLADAIFGGIKGIDADKIFGEITKSIGDAFKSVTDSMLSDAQRQIDAIQRVIDTLDDQINTQEDVVKRQQDLSDKGLANDLINQQKQLDTLRANKTAEIAAQQRAQDEYAKIKKQEAALQAASILATNIEIGVHLANAAAKAFEGAAGIPIAGIAIGIGLVALLVSSFLAIKNAIGKAVGPAPSFKEGGGMLLKGRSHDEGGIGLYDGNRKIAEYEGDEYLYAVSKPKTKKYLPLLQAINQDDFPSMKKHLSGILGGSRMPDHALRETLDLMHDNEATVIQNEKERAQLYKTLNRRGANKSESKESTTIIHDGNLESIDENIKELVSLHKAGKKEVYDMGDYILEIEGNRQRKIFKKRG